MKKHIFYLSAVAVASSLLISNLNAFEVNEKKVDAKRVLELKNEGYVLLDTRPEAEFKKCTIAGAQNNPIKDADAFMEWAKKLQLDLRWKTIEQSLGHGQKMIQDFKKRLPNVLKDIRGASTEKSLKDFIFWLETAALTLESNQKHTGATVFYHFRKVS